MTFILDDEPEEDTEDSKRIIDELLDQLTNILIDAMLKDQKLDGSIYLNQEDNSVYIYIDGEPKKFVLDLE